MSDSGTWGNKFNSWTGDSAFTHELSRLLSLVNIAASELLIQYKQNVRFSQQVDTLLAYPCVFALNLNVNIYITISGGVHCMPFSREVVADAKLVLEEERWATAPQLTLGHHRLAVSQHVCLVHEVRRQQDHLLRGTSQGRGSSNITSFKNPNQNTLRGFIFSTITVLFDGSFK